MGAAIGNKYALKWTDEDALEAFHKALEYAETNPDCLCMQDAVYHSGMPGRTFYNFVEKGDVWQTIKHDINDAIIRRVNRGSIKGAYPPAPSIWRMKQLGESDKVEQETTLKTPDIETWAAKFRRPKS